MPNSQMPSIDALEPRLCLSVTVAPLLVSTAGTDGGIVVLKKDGDGGDESAKPKGKAKKHKKSPEIMVLLNGTSLVNAQATVNFGRVTVGDAGPLRTFLIHNDGKGQLS